MVPVASEGDGDSFSGVNERRGGARCSVGGVQREREGGGRRRTAKWRGAAISGLSSIRDGPEVLWNPTEAKEELRKQPNTSAAAAGLPPGRRTTTRCWKPRGSRAS